MLAVGLKSFRSEGILLKTLNKSESIRHKSRHPTVKMLDFFQATIKHACNCIKLSRMLLPSKQDIFIMQENNKKLGLKDNFGIKAFLQYISKGFQGY